MSKKDLPRVPSLMSSLGPSFILLGLALGSGELIMWPFLSANYGLGLLWGALLGISFQFFLNTEIMRYSLYWGESVFAGFFRLSRHWPWWFVVSTFIPWGLPGFSSASAQIFGSLFLLNDTKWLAIAILILTGLVLTLGKTLYTTMEKIQKIVIFAGFPFILLLVLLLSSGQDWLDLGKGLIGKGDGFWFFPAGISLAAFLGAVAYSGAGGNLNLTQSYYIKEKGMGMGKWAVKIKSLLLKNKEAPLRGQSFVRNQENESRFFAWWKLVNGEHFLVFWLLGFLTIILLSLLAKSLVFGETVFEGIEFLFYEASEISLRLNNIFGVVFLILAGVMLYSTQLGVLESSSRIISENIALSQKGIDKPVNLSLYFYLALWFQISLGVTLLLLGVEEPRFLLTLSAVLNAFAMTISFPLIFILNRKRLASQFQPTKIRKAVLLLAFVFFVVFDFLVIKNLF